MNRLITAIAAASLLLAGPALADRAGHAKSQLTGSALEQAYSKHRDARRDGWRRDDREKRVSGHRPARHDHDHRRDRDHRRGRDHRRDRDHSRGHHGRLHRDKYKHKYRHGHKHKYRHGYKHRDRWHRGKHHRKRHHRHWRPDRFRYGYRWRHLPRNFVRISFGSQGFFYSNGIFYRPHSHGYVVAPAPIGAVVHSLPGTAVSVVFGGRNYYLVYDTYYLWDSARRGYRVVADPGFY